MEFSIPVAGEVAVLRQLPENVKVGLGCVDVRFPEIEPPERIGLKPDCGFAPGKDHEVPLEEAYAS